MIRKRKKRAMDMKTTKRMLLYLTERRALLEKAWSQVCQMMIRRATDPSLETLYLVQTVLVVLGKSAWTIWPATCME